MCVEDCEELHWPFGDPYLLNVTILAWIVFRDIFKLSNGRERCFGTFSALGKCKRLGVGREGIVIVTAIFEVGRAALWVAPNAVFQEHHPKHNQPLAFANGESVPTRFGSTASG